MNHALYLSGLVVRGDTKKRYCWLRGLARQQTPVQSIDIYIIQMYYIYYSALTNRVEMSWMIYSPAILRAFRSTRNKTRPDHRKPEPVLCRLLIPASGVSACD